MVGERTPKRVLLDEAAREAEKEERKS